MARTWWSVTVELLGGRGEELWPPPGRILAVGPSHTFFDLAAAINDAFARWDRSHLSLFTLSDGRIVTDEYTGAEMTESVGGPLLSPLDIAAAKVSRTVRLGDEFQYTFDLGDNWTHRCTVAETKVDPEEELGIRPKAPLAYWGWGSMPDQYGRRWSDDDGESRAPRRPSRPDPMLTHDWPAAEQIPAVDTKELRAAIANRDADRFLAAVMGHDIDDALQQVGEGLPMLLEERRQDAEPVVLSVHNRLTWRGGAGDRELAADLLARLRREPLGGRVVPVDLEMLTYELEGEPGLETVGYLDLRTGEVISHHLLDPEFAEEDDVPDLEEDPERWLPVEPLGSRDGWRDMAAFSERQRDRQLRERLQRAIEGKGAFRRFRDLTDEEDLVDQWRTFATDRQLGRARAFLAGEGVRIGVKPAR